MSTSQLVTAIQHSGLRYIGLHVHGALVSHCEVQVPGNVKLSYIIMMIACEAMQHEAHALLMMPLATTWASAITPNTLRISPSLPRASILQTEQKDRNSVKLA